MTTTEERMKILRMVEAGKISAAEGAELLKALTDHDIPQTEEEERESVVPRWLHVRITDTETGQKKVNINVPLGLVNIGIKMGARFAPDIEAARQGDLLNSIQEAIKAGERGKIVDLTNDEGEHVEVFIE